MCVLDDEETKLRAEQLMFGRGEELRRAEEGPWRVHSSANF